MVSLRREKGQGIVEYVIILALIAIIVMVILPWLGRLIGAVFSNIVSCLNGKCPITTARYLPCRSTRPSIGGPPVAVEVQFTSLEQCQAGLPTTLSLYGLYEGDMTDQEIWILVYPTDLEYYPQLPCGQSAINASDGQWHTTVHFGGPPQQYDVVAVITEADGEASQEFKAWLEQGCAQNDLSGYLRVDLPAGLTEVAALTVSTKPAAVAWQHLQQPSSPGKCSFDTLPDRIPLGGPAVDIKATVTSPSHCAKGLDTTINIGGDYTGELNGKELWILVYPTDAKYYPQTMNACRQFSVDASAGKWNTVVNFGGPPQQYDLVAVITEADGLASREFKAWLQGGCATQHFPGYSPNYLPGGLTELAAITVSTQ